jgi:hypothetical protein
MRVVLRAGPLEEREVYRVSHRGVAHVSWMQMIARIERRE